MEYVLLGWPEAGPTLTLDWQRFSYAGKFVMSNTGKAVVRTGEVAGPPVTDDGDAAADVVAAAAFNEDRTDSSVCWIRYITVREDRRGDGIGPDLAAFVAARARDRGYDRARIAVNNPFAYQALYRAGFAFTGEETGVAELVLDRPLGEGSGATDAGRPAADRSRSTYQAGLDIYRERAETDDGPGLSADEREFLVEKGNSGPPGPVDPPA
ncbi:N-acetyltransferase GCN5 [Halosimplex carlsbadense 2-9-1]|uniref:N-acetyltransferase GCN5 n=1 Tax=Halosimplex carlsbadense 2-9-1 TaxID=797114 RepID=M0CXS1_9EURY|nr:GNAT family N-acetyltransferase [Halosimplex carlsbadense]ELZ27433.1 N-acetyltransferase GCN5 [Halosimplex carlsbadense 2-9-1]